MHNNINPIRNLIPKEMIISDNHIIQGRTKSHQDILKVLFLI
jgi:hypothetical protein